MGFPLGTYCCNYGRQCQTSVTTTYVARQLAEHLSIMKSRYLESNE